MSWTSGYFQKELGEKKAVAGSILCLCEHAERSDLCPGTNAFLWWKKAMLALRDGELVLREGKRDVRYVKTTYLIPAPFSWLP